MKKEQEQTKKWIKLILIWIIIPLFLDFINIFFLGSRLPKLLIMFDFYVSTIFYSATAWIAYTAIITGISKRKRS